MLLEWLMLDLWTWGTDELPWEAQKTRAQVFRGFNAQIWRYTTHSIGSFPLISDTKLNYQKLIKLYIVLQLVRDLCYYNFVNFMKK